MRKLAAGESKVISSTLESSEPKKFEVIAEAYDEETPLVFIEDDEGGKLFLTDVEAEDLMKQLEKALQILPTSK